jgi:hypothetical protein
MVKNLLLADREAKYNCALFADILYFFTPWLYKSD